MVATASIVGQVTGSSLWKSLETLAGLPEDVLELSPLHWGEVATQQYKPRRRRRADPCLVELNRLCKLVELAGCAPSATMALGCGVVVAHQSSRALGKAKARSAYIKHLKARKAEAKLAQNGTVKDPLCLRHRSPSHVYGLSGMVVSGSNPVRRCKVCRGKFTLSWRQLEETNSLPRKLARHKYRNQALALEELRRDGYCLPQVVRRKIYYSKCVLVWLTELMDTNALVISSRGTGARTPPGFYAPDTVASADGEFEHVYWKPNAYRKYRDGDVLPPSDPSVSSLKRLSKGEVKAIAGSDSQPINLLPARIVSRVVRYQKYKRRVREGILWLSGSGGSQTIRHLVDRRRRARASRWARVKDNFERRNRVSDVRRAKKSWVNHTSYQGNHPKVFNPAGLSDSILPAAGVGYWKKYWGLVRERRITALLAYHKKLEDYRNDPINLMGFGDPESEASIELERARLRSRYVRYKRM